MLSGTSGKVGLAAAACGRARASGPTSRPDEVAKRVERVCARGLGVRR